MIKYISICLIKFTFCKYNFNDEKNDAPVALQVGVGQGVVRDYGAKAQVIELLALGAQADIQIAQTLASGQLDEGHDQELVAAVEGLDE
jgi:hypothetical protein